jgi:GNAT superfamily N-acetyltransferase
MAAKRRPTKGPASNRGSERLPPTKKGLSRKVEFFPVDENRWPDMVRLFGERGACEGCWCMWWRGTRADYKKNQGAGNKRRMKRLIDSGVVPGILAYSGGEPVGWCSIGPRESYDALGRSRVLKRIDDKPVWSIVCFFVAMGHRRKGLSVRLVKAAVKYARSQGAEVVEGYPVEPKVAYPDAWAYPGYVSAFEKAGFSVAKRWSKVRPIMRYPG